MDLNSHVLSAQRGAREPPRTTPLRSYAGHGAHTVGGGVVRWPARAQHKCASALDPN